ncbi:MAG: hypothetical protein AB1638_07825 [Nitrospirota bacterium]
MNTERLYNLLQIIKHDFESLKIISVTKSFVSTFSQNIQQPSPQFSKDFNSAKINLKTVLSQCDSNNFVPSQYKMLLKIGGDKCTGLGLLSEFERIMNENILTPGNAVTQVQEHFNIVTKFFTAVQTTISSFETLGIKYTKESEYEVGFLLPCKVLNNDLEGLQKELNLINRHMKAICEIASRDTASPQIRSLSSGSIEVFLNALPEVARCIGECIEKITLLYLAVLQIRKYRLELKQAKVPKKDLEPIEKHEKTMVKDEIDKLTEEIFKKYHKEKTPNRANELKGHLRKAIEFFANRIDKGVDIEVTPPKLFSTEGSTEENPAEKLNTSEAELIAMLRTQGRALLQIKSRSQEIVLALPEPEAEDSEKK